MEILFNDIANPFHKKSFIGPKNGWLMGQILMLKNIKNKLES
jgi:hypothetical protein